MIMDGDIMWCNRSPGAHEPPVQVLDLQVHDGHTVEINHFQCDPFSADFDGDHLLCVNHNYVGKSEDLELLVLRDN